MKPTWRGELSVMVTKCRGLIRSIEADRDKLTREGHDGVAAGMGITLAKAREALAAYELALALEDKGKRTTSTLAATRGERLIQDALQSFVDATEPVANV